MILVKQLFLKLRLSFGAKKQKEEGRDTIDFEKSKKIGLVIFPNDPSLINKIEDFAKEMIKEGKKVEALCFTYQPSPIRFTFPCHYFSYKDLDWKGNLKGETINKFIKTPFDYLYSINILPILPFNLIFSKSKAKCRVGKYEGNAKLDLMIQIGDDKGLDYLLEQMKFYSKKITCDVPYATA